MPDPAGLSLYKDADFLGANNGSCSIVKNVEIFFFFLTQLELLECDSKSPSAILPRRAIYIPEYRTDPDSHGLKPWNTYRAEG